jgi:hypothetical protein
VISWSAAFKNWCLILPGGSTAKTAMGETFSREVSSAWTTSAFLTGQNPCLVAEIFNRLTEQPGWRFYCLTMMAMAMELVHDNDRLQSGLRDMASKFFEHFIQISEAMNTLGGSGLWDEEDGFIMIRFRWMAENRFA